MCRCTDQAYHFFLTNLTLEIKKKEPKKEQIVKQRFADSPLNVDYPKYQFIEPLAITDNAKKRIFLESKENEFFGLNTTVFKNEGILTGVYNKLEDYYKNTAEVSCQLVCRNCLSFYLSVSVCMSDCCLLRIICPTSTRMLWMIIWVD